MNVLLWCVCSEQRLTLMLLLVVLTAALCAVCSPLLTGTQQAQGDAGLEDVPYHPQQQQQQ
jgi:hypothetical protein